MVEGSTSSSLLCHRYSPKLGSCSPIYRVPPKFDRTLARSDTATILLRQGFGGHKTLFRCSRQVPRPAPARGANTLQRLVIWSSHRLNRVYLHLCMPLTCSNHFQAGGTTGNRHRSARIDKLLRVFSLSVGVIGWPLGCVKELCLAMLSIVMAPE